MRSAPSPTGSPLFAAAPSYEVRARLRNVPLVRGEYELVVYVGDENALHVFDRRDLRPAFTIAGDRYEIGLMAVDHEWEVNGHRISSALPAAVPEALHAE